jgi:DUF1680 family protein
VTLELDMPVEIVRAHPEVEADTGLIAIQRGPVVYCVEEAANGHLSYLSIKIMAAAPMFLEDRPDLLGGVVTLTGRTEEERPCTLIPYYAWDNRTPGFMQVWLQEAESRSLYRY